MRPIELISHLDEDSTLESTEVDLRVKRVNVANIMECPEDWRPSALENRLIIFDDIEGFPVRVRHRVQEVISEIGNKGRHTSTSMIVTMHVAADREKTRAILNEASWIITFPLSTNPKFMKYLMDEYIGLEPKATRKVLRTTDSRWVGFYVRMPRVIATQTGVYMQHYYADNADAASTEKGVDSPDKTSVAAITSFLSKRNISVADEEEPRGTKRKRSKNGRR
jgi:hypothetical protein